MLEEFKPASQGLIHILDNLFQFAISAATGFLPDRLPQVTEAFFPGNPLCPG